ncbi:MAG: DDE-type integrase/transposase/recombinase [Zoogloea sp.]|uniref:DDE-type integrase/transposase/recombinase n=1 Tax=Zoogloea sp. TaxID=49181 RepID=UPI002609AAA6|nr:DDE-type integrase/transposase/recombinase [Zoogloea sp.]MDD3328894.1 DDE-type integrase/transposase/recombinase [Zoogloea sp.]
MTRKTHYSCGELAAMKLPGMPGSEMGWSKLVKREGYDFREVPARGGKAGLRREYAPPAAVAKLIDRAEGIIAAGDKAARVQAAVAEVVRQQDTADATRQAKGEAALMALVDKLTPGQRTRFDARLAIVQGWEVWFVQAQPIRKKAGLDLYARQYNDDDLPAPPQITAAVREAYPSISARSVERWHTDYSRDGLAGLIDKQDGHLTRDVNVFTRQPALYNTTLALLVAKPHIKNSDMLEMLRHAAVDEETGEILFEVPSIWATDRFLRAWREKHPELLLAATDPDSWKNKAMAAVGNASEDVRRLNQRWEMDATPADWMLLDPETGQRRRYTCSVCIDVYSRRMVVVLARTPKAQTHMFCLRLALLAWGVPEEVVTDNGKDYLARAFKLALDALKIKHRVTNPFSPWEKPHVERGIGVMLHSILEVLPNFVGHSVAERSAIEARQTFAERLFKKDTVVELDISPDELNGHIQNWLAGTYHQRAHGGTGESPFALAAAWAGKVRQVGDERALDVLLMPTAAGGGVRTLQKKGIEIERGWYAAPELFRKVEVGTEVLIRETEDFGQVVVYQGGDFVCVAICPERKGVSRKELAAHCRNAQTKRLKADKAALRKAAQVDPDKMVADLLRKKASAAGKLATLPGTRVTHTTHGLHQAGLAAKRIDGGAEAPALPVDIARGLAERRAAAAQPEKVTPLPETPDQRFRRWLDLNATVEKGEVIADPKAQKWWGMYPQSSEFKALSKRHQAQMNTGTTAATVVPVRTATN